MPSPMPMTKAVAAGMTKAISRKTSTIRFKVCIVLSLLAAPVAVITVPSEVGVVHVRFRLLVYGMRPQEKEGDRGKNGREFTHYAFISPRF